MKFTMRYPSPVGELLLASNGEALTGLWLEGQNYYGEWLEPNAEPMDSLPVFLQAKRWLDDYFEGKNPAVQSIPVSFDSTPFRREIWQLLLEIPYGQVVTYGQLAKRYAEKTGHTTSARAVGGAVGRNPISIIVPCHRVVGAGEAITGYAGGLEKKRMLLALEGITGY